jgi:hypothetical protein
VGFVATVAATPAAATKPSSCVGFVALVGRGAIIATTPTLASVHFVALTPPAAIGATLCT